MGIPREFSQEKFLHRKLIKTRLKKGGKKNPMSTSEINEIKNEMQEYTQEEEKQIPLNRTIWYVNNAIWNEDVRRVI